MSAKILTFRIFNFEGIREVAESFLYEDITHKCYLFMREGIYMLMAWKSVNVFYFRKVNSALV